jgi:hypothetical protein
MPTARLAAIRDCDSAEATVSRERNGGLLPGRFLIDPQLHDELTKLGYRLLSSRRRAMSFTSEAFQERRRPGSPTCSIEETAGAGCAWRRKETRADLPAVIRPDLVLTDGDSPGRHGFAIAELDTVPGGIGLIGWLNQLYDGFGTHDVIGRGSGMIDGFRSVVPEGRVLISREAETYKPEMHWMAGQSDGALVVEDAEAFSKPQPHYRFYELFDLPNLPAAALLASSPVTPPLKAFLEEKLWFALFWSRPLREYWRRELSERHFLALQKVVPFTWVLDPTPLPHHAVIPGWRINDWRELAAFSQKHRILVIKISGFSEIGWGARSVKIGSDLPHQEWQTAIEHALDRLSASPWILQRFHKLDSRASLLRVRQRSHRDDERPCAAEPVLFRNRWKSRTPRRSGDHRPADKKSCMDEETQSWRRPADLCGISSPLYRLTSLVSAYHWDHALPFETDVANPLQAKLLPCGRWVPFPGRSTPQRAWNLRT